MGDSYPEDSAQGILELLYEAKWWEKDTDKPTLCLGRLIHAYVPMFDLIPQQLDVEGRASDTEHKALKFKLTALNVHQRNTPPTLPAAALPFRPKEHYVVQRAKRRPCIVVSLGGDDVERAMIRNKPKSQGHRFLLVAPSFGADEDGRRAGYHRAFVERIWRMEYPQFMADHLPLPGTKESILRFDQLQPLGAHHQSYKLTPYRLSPKACLLVQDWILWLLNGVRGELLEGIREELQIELS